MPSFPRRFYLCTGECVTAENLRNYPHSHIIGELRYVVDEERKVTALAVYEVSIRTSCIPPTAPRIRVELIGDARGIKCTYLRCGHEERWEIGKAAFLSLMSRYGKVMA